jgi:hypothetical protein
MLTTSCVGRFLKEMAGAAKPAARCADSKSITFSAEASQGMTPKAI